MKKWEVLEGAYRTGSCLVDCEGRIAGYRTQSGPHHHEQVSGGGYRSGLAGDLIPRFAPGVDCGCLRCDDQ